MEVDVEHHTTNKAPFNELFRGGPEERQALFDYVDDCHWLVYHTTHVLKLLLLKDASLRSNVTISLIPNIMYLLNGPYTPRSIIKRQTLVPIRETIEDYREHVPQCKPIGLSSVQQTIHYLSTTIKTNITVNVQSHFVCKLLAFIHRRLQVREARKKLKGDKEALKNYNTRLRLLRDALILDTDVPTDLDLTDDEHILLEEVRDILPYTETQKESLAYNVASNADRFFPSYCRLSSAYEAYGYPQFSAIPLRRGKAVNFAPIDTKILCTHIYKTPSLIRNMMSEKHMLWNDMIDLEHKACRPRRNMSFNGRISTDGVSISVCLDDSMTSYGHKKKRVRKSEKDIIKKESYFEYHVPELLNACNYVVIDPNKRDLLFCRDALSQKTLRYTSNQRVFESKSRKYRKLLEEVKAEWNISEIESTTPTHKTMKMDAYITYLVAMNHKLPKLRKFYSMPIHNKLKFNAFMNTKRSEDRFVNKLKRKYSDENGNISPVIMGDWSDAGHTMKFQKSSKTKGWEKVFKRNKVPFYLIDEYGTSKRCPKCFEDTGRPFKRLSPRPWRKAKGQVDAVNGLLGCQNLQCIKQVRLSTSNPDVQYRFWNRDASSTLNILTIVASVLHTGIRPPRFCRSTNLPG
jgi:hypothetical protein